MPTIRNSSIIINIGGSSNVEQKVSVGVQPEQSGSSPEQIAEVIRREIRDLLSEQLFLQSLQKTDLIKPQEEVAALPDHSNIAPSANALRIAAKHAMKNNEIAKACRFIEQAEDIEARAEADAIRKADRFEFKAQEARTMALAQSVSRAETQSAHAAILYDLSDFDGAKRLYESAIQRLPESEKELRGWYSKRLRITLNNIAARPARPDLVRTILFENRYAAPPDVASYSILIRRAPDDATARAVLAEMKTAGIAPNVITFNSLIAAAPDYPEARAVLAEMKTAGIAPDVITFSSLIAAAPDYPEARAVLAEMKTAGIAPNDFTATTLARFLESPDQASELRLVLRTYKVAGNHFHRAVFAKLCKSLNAKELLDWAFSGGGGVPFAAFDTPIAIYRRQKKIDDALRIASAFPYLDACRIMFREEANKSFDYLRNRFEKNEEPQYAAYALGVYHEELGQISEAIKWLVVAQEHPQTLDNKKVNIQKSIDKLRG